MGSRWRDRWNDAPWWVLSILLALYFSAVMTVGLTISKHGVFHPETLGLGLASGVFFGAGMGPVLVRRRDDARAAMRPLDDRDRAQVVRAANRGTVPVDPQLRAAAARLLRYRLGEMSRQRRWAIPMWAAFMLLSTTLAVVRTPWWLMATAFWATFMIISVVQPRRMMRRLQALEAAS